MKFFWDGSRCHVEHENASIATRSVAFAHRYFLLAPGVSVMSGKSCSRDTISDSLLFRSVRNHFVTLYVRKILFLDILEQ